MDNSDEMSEYIQHYGVITINISNGNIEWIVMYKISENNNNLDAILSICWPKTQENINKNTKNSNPRRS